MIHVLLLSLGRPIHCASHDDKRHQRNIWIELLPAQHLQAEVATSKTLIHHDINDGKKYYYDCHKQPLNRQEADFLKVYTHVHVHIIYTCCRTSSFKACLKLFIVCPQRDFLGVNLKGRMQALLIKYSYVPFFENLIHNKIVWKSRNGTRVVCIFTVGLQICTLHMLESAYYLQADWTGCRTGNAEKLKAATKQSQVRPSNQLLLSFLPFPPIWPRSSE